MKICSVCGRELAETEFRKLELPDGRHDRAERCKACEVVRAGSIRSLVWGIDG